MIPTKLVTGGTAAKRKKVILQIIQMHLGLTAIKPDPDLIILAGFNSVGIAQIRELKNKLALKPYQGKVKIGLILEAEKLTLAAQNALLKTLEEPNASSLIILACPVSTLLLPTILSRCQIIRLASENQLILDKDQLVFHRQLAQKILKSRLGERLKIALSQTKTKEAALDFVQSQLIVWHQIMLKKPTLVTANNLHHLQKALRLLKANLNPNLVIGHLLLSF